MSSNARHILYFMKGWAQEQHIAALPTPEFCADVAPTKINGYVDGSVRHHTQKQHAIGGSAALFPNRVVDELPLSEYEPLIVRTDWVDGGLELVTDHVGVYINSDRTGVVGTLISMGIPSELLLGIDNQAACDDVDDIQSVPYAQSHPNKPWALVHHGDLLRLVHDQSYARGRDSLKVTRVRGHATDQ